MELVALVNAWDVEGMSLHRLNIDIKKYTCKLASEFKTQSGILQDKEFGAITILCDEIKGFGDISLSPSLNSGNLDENIKQIDICLNNQFIDTDNKDPISLSKQIDDLTQSLSNPAKAGVSNAILDMLGKHNNINVSSLLKIATKNVISSCYTIDRASHYKLEEKYTGYKYLKFKTDCSINDVERILRFIEHIDLPIWLDPESDNINKEQIYEFYSLLNHSIELIEDPLPFPPNSEWKELKIDSLIFADKYISNITDIKKYSPYINGVVIKPIRFGGILKSLEAIKYAKEQKLKVMLGCYVEPSSSISAWFLLAGLVDFIDLDGNSQLTNEIIAGVYQTDHGLKRLNIPGIGIKKIKW